jgi:hypothetical protein
MEGRRMNTNPIDLMSNDLIKTERDKLRLIIEQVIQLNTTPDVKIKFLEEAYKQHNQAFSEMVESYKVRGINLEL